MDRSLQGGTVGNGNNGGGMKKYLLSGVVAGALGMAMALELFPEVSKPWAVTVGPHEHFLAGTGEGQPQTIQ